MAIVETVYLYGLLPAAYLALCVHFFREAWNRTESTETRRAGTRQEKLKNGVASTLIAIIVPVPGTLFLGYLGLRLIQGDQYVVALAAAIPVSLAIAQLIKRTQPSLYTRFQSYEGNYLPVWIWALAAIGIFVLLGRDPW